MGILTSSSPFSPVRWFSNGHLQTLGASLPLWTSLKAFERHEEKLMIPVDDGALVARAWWQEDKAPKTAVVLVHGVGGDVSSKYVVRAAVALHRAGMHAIRLNLRGAGEGIHTSSSLYHAGLTVDLRKTIDYLLQKEKVTDVALVGFSLGGNVTLKLAGEWGADYPERVRAMCAISPPLDLVTTGASLERKRSYPYRRYVLDKLKETGETFAQLYPEKAKYDVSRLKKAKVIREYDELVVAPMHGFASARDYYTKQSSGPWLPKIRVPTLLVHAEDDPMIPPHTMKPSLEHVSPAVTVEWTKLGGHVGFFGSFDEDGFVQTWAMKRAIRFIEEQTPKKD
ncbi:MAG TPA: alpha/beta fold hydrolase [Polyangiaceae bacterium]